MGKKKGKKGPVKWLLRSILGIFAALIVVIAGAFFVITHPDSGPVKGYILDKVRTSTGIRVDFKSAALGLSKGIRITGLSIENPKIFQKYAKNLLFVKKIDISWYFQSLFSDKKTFSIDIERPDIRMVMDAKGRTAFDIWFGPSKKETKKTPLSGALDMGDLGIDAKNMKISGMMFEMLNIDAYGKTRTLVVNGMNLNGSLLVAKKKQRANLEIGAKKGGAISIKTGEKHAKIPLNIRIRLDGNKVRANIDAGMREQNFADLKNFAFVLKRDRLVSAGLQVVFDKKAGMVRARLDNLNILGKMIVAKARVQLPDTPKQGIIARLNDLSIDISGSKLLKSIIKATLKTVSVSGVNANIMVKKAAIMEKPPFIDLKEPAKVKIGAKEVRVRQGDMLTVIQGLKLDALATKDNDFRVKTGIKLMVRAVSTDMKGMTAKLADIRAGLDLLGIGADLKPDKGDMALRLDTGTIDVKAHGTHLAAQGMKLGLAAPADIKGPVNMDGRVSLKRFSMNMPAGRLGPADAGMKISVKDGRINEKTPKESTGRIKINVKFAGLDLAMNAKKGSDRLDAKITLDMPNMAVPGRFMPGSVRKMRIPFGKTGLRLAIKAMVKKMFSRRPDVDADIDAGLTGLAMTTGGRRLGLPKIGIKGRVKVTGPDMNADATIDVSRPGLGRGRVFDRLDMKVIAGKKAGRFSVDIHTTGVKNGKKPVEITLKATANRTFRAVTWDAGLQLRDLDKMKSFIDHQMGKKVGKMLDIPGLTVAFQTKGRAKTRTRLTDLKQLNLNQNARLDIGNISVTRGTTEVKVPNISINLDTTLEKNTANGQMNIHSDLVNIATDKMKVIAKGLGMIINAKTKGLDASGTMDITTITNIERIKTPFDKYFPIRGLSIGLKTRLGNDATVDTLVIDNKGTKTRLQLNGLMAGVLAPKMGLAELKSRKNVYITGKLTQNMAGLAGNGIRASGMLTMPFRVESPDQGLFRFLMTPEAANVDVRMKGLKIRGLRGRIPVLQEVFMGAKGPVLVMGKKTNIYSLVRYTDMHPFLATRAYIAMDGLDIGPVSLGPLAGNLRITRNIFSMDQLQAGWNHGQVAGQLVVQYDKKDPRVYFRGRVTGVRPKNGDERLDANAALYFSLGKQTLSGRVHLIHIGRRHLTDVLDAADPYRENTGINRIRKLLSIAYPKYVRIRMDQGFLSAKVALGGLGSLVKIQEVRGIPTGPILRKVLSEFQLGVPK